jgi:predicted RNase H-like nuclease (RuvC/YqgF family)
MLTENNNTGPWFESIADSNHLRIQVSSQPGRHLLGNLWCKMGDMGSKEITLKEENNELKIKMSDSLEKAEAQDDEIYDLTRSNGIQKSTNQKLHRELNKLREKNQIERSKVIKDLKVKIKACRKSLGMERTAKIKLENKLKLTENLLPNKVKSKSTNTGSSLLPTASFTMSSTCSNLSKSPISGSFNLSSQSEASSQTVTHPDVPYQINSPLPQIFNS